MSKATPLTIIIVGNGIAGPILAMALKKVTPHNVILVDGGPEETLPLGAGLGIAPNGLHALRFIEAEHLVVDKGGRLEYMAFRRGDSNETLAEQPIGDLFSEKYGFSSYGVVRSEYCRGLRALAKERGVDMRFKLRLKSITETDKIVTAHFTNGEDLSADLLIGCDGIHSPTRAYVVGEDIKPDFANASVIVGLSKLTSQEEETLNLKKGFNMHLGSKASVGVLPLDQDGTWGWFAGFHTVDPAGGETAWGNDHSIEELTNLAQSKVEGWQNLVPSKVISKTFRCFPIPLYDRQPIATWHRGRVVLCGDAAHPTTPAGGQGAQMAAESAIILARLLGENEPSDDLFKRYASIRHPRTDWVTKNSRRTVNTLFVPTTNMWQAIRDIAISLLGGFVFRSGFLGQYGYDPGNVAL
ncbi:hypothetical protein M408DRAFT_24927 [Serendipita vermifera MAFF 305830]|uniref:FAD-binding domain-containing protein n=1 Tax=Serendipita vermifera MAFF 305830 TaxID=933852 RepID=A0A0C3B600_SERVB|nr:hypothetical protein M408DRAFT_24927 [Serendipita vermifera MAFF 305830]